MKVGVDGVVSALLQRVGFELAQKADAAALMPSHIYEDSPPLRLDCPKRTVQLKPTVAALGMEYIPRETLRMHADEDVLALADPPLDECDVLGAIE